MTINFVGLILIKKAMCFLHKLQFLSDKRLNSMKFAVEPYFGDPIVNQPI